ARAPLGSGCGATRPLLTSPWSHCDWVQLVEPGVIEYSWIWPPVPSPQPASTRVPEPEASIVCLVFEQLPPVPSESTVISPGCVGSPTSVLEPPDALR